MVDNSRSRRSGSGCSQSAPECPSNSGNKALLRKLQAIDFAIADTILYLDAYPNCTAALAYLSKLNAEREKLADMLAKSGYPLTAVSGADTASWQWTNGPWPWQPEAN